MDRREGQSIYDDPSRSGRRKKPSAKRARRMLVVFFVFLMVYFGTAIVKAQVDLYQANQELRELDEVLFQLQLEKETLEHEREFVESEEYVEFKAKRELGLLKPGETLIILKDPGEDEQQP